MSHALETVGARQRSLPLLTALFVGVTTVTSVAWFEALAISLGSIDFSTTSSTALMFAAMILSAIPAAWIHQQAPDPVDRFHSLGIYFAMFAMANLLVTSGFFVADYVSGPSAIGPVEYVLQGAVVSSLFLPGPYAGIVLARRWLA